MRKGRGHGVLTWNNPRLLAHQEARKETSSMEEKIMGNGSKANAVWEKPTPLVVLEE